VKKRARGDLEIVQRERNWRVGVHKTDLRCGSRWLCPVGGNVGEEKIAIWIMGKILRLKGREGNARKKTVELDRGRSAKPAKLASKGLTENGEKKIKKK